MGVFGELFPSPKIRREAGEAGSGQQWRLGPIDLDKGVIELQPVEVEPAEDEAEETTSGPDAPERG